MIKLPKLVLTDIDGVWTDGGMYYDQTGNEWKKFNTSDSAGVLLLQALRIEIGIITGEQTAIVARRAKKLNITRVFQGASDKLFVAQNICEAMGISLCEVAYIGDDVQDLRLLRKVGISGAPANAASYIRDEVQFVTVKAGGEGAFREFIEKICEAAGELDRVLRCLWAD